jgi:hypothetical protein
MTHTVGIGQFEGRVEATVFTLPGCGATAVTEAALLSLLPLSIAEFTWWLETHGDAPDTSSGFDILERIDAAQTGAADGEFAYASDREPASDNEIERALRWLAFARDDLTALTVTLPDAILDWRPPDSAMARIDPWKPHALTIREILADIVGAEGYYRSGISAAPEANGAAELANATRERERTIARLHGLAAADRSRLFRVRRPWQPEGTAEEWTARKAIRRMLSHERFHTKEIEQRLAWLLLGIPGHDLA